MIRYDCIDELNEIINHPDVYDGHLITEKQEGPIDCTEYFERGAFGVIGEGFGFLLDPLVPGVYEVHTSIMPEFRHKSKAITLESMGEVFTQTSALEIVTRIKNNPAAKQLALSVGMRKTFERDDVEYFSIHISQWAATADQFIPVGEKFHTTLEEAGAESDHGKDENHDHYVGIAMAMAYAGLLEKGVWFYSMWARLANFAPIQALSDNKFLIGNSIVQFVDNELTVLAIPNQKADPITYYKEAS